eukprot:gene3754-7453_t
MGNSASINTDTKITLEEFRSAVGDRFDENVFLKAAKGKDTVTFRQIKELEKSEYDVYLSFDLGINDDGRKNVDIVTRVNDILKSFKIKAFFEHDHIGSVTLTAIDKSQLVLVFLTRRYHDKVIGSDSKDYTQIEYLHCNRQKTADNMIPVVVEPSMRDQSQWTSSLAFLRNIPFIDISDDSKFRDSVNALAAEIKSRIVPLADRRRASVVSSTATTKSQQISTNIPCYRSLLELSNEELICLFANIKYTSHIDELSSNRLTGRHLHQISQPHDLIIIGFKTLSVANAKLLYTQLQKYKRDGVPDTLLEPPPRNTNASSIAARETRRQSVIALSSAAAGQGHNIPGSGGIRRSSVCSVPMGFNGNSPSTSGSISNRRVSLNDPMKMALAMQGTTTEQSVIH